MIRVRVYLRAKGTKDREVLWRSMKYWFLSGLCVIPIAAIATEVDLSAKGLGEAKSAGGLLKSEGIKVDMAFTSYLKRVLALSEHAFSWIFGWFTDVSMFYAEICDKYDCYMTVIWLIIMTVICDVCCDVWWMCGGAIKTCDLALEAADQLHVPVTKSWRLNERMYGALTGLDKKETHGKLSSVFIT